LINIKTNINNTKSGAHKWLLAQLSKKLRNFEKTPKSIICHGNVQGNAIVPSEVAIRNLGKPNKVHQNFQINNETNTNGASQC
jgi:hypothetical protein